MYLEGTYTPCTYTPRCVVGVCVCAAYSLCIWLSRLYLAPAYMESHVTASYYGAHVQLYNARRVVQHMDQRFAGSALIHC